MDELAARLIHPTKEIIRSQASILAGKPVSETWVTRFIHRNADQLTNKWTSAIGTMRHAANSRDKYKLYFNMLQAIITNYNVKVENTYNIDEKGFMVGAVGKQKQIFTKSRYAKKQFRRSLQDGNREWITLLACCCADGSALPLGIIYTANTKNIQSTWVDEVDVRKHEVFVNVSPSGWSNNDIGLAWLEQVFERNTAKKARRRYRLLILDSHSSHLTEDFLEYCH